MLDLESAIQHCEEKAKELRKRAFDDYANDKTTLAEFADCRECASEHEQLAGWLKELKAWREWQTVYADSSIIVMKKENNNETDN